MSKLLLIEDNPEVRENTAELLELSNYEVITAENGKIGVEYARQHKPDLIICDIMMPELDGYGVLFSLSKNPQTAAIPFIFLSAKADKTDIRRGMTLGADDYLTKPFTEMELLEAVETRLRKNDLLKKEYSLDAEGYESFVREAQGLDEAIKQTGTGTHRSFKKKDTIFRERQYAHYLYLIESGKVKTFRTNEEGKEYITGIHAQGDYLGYTALFEDTPYAENADALADTELYMIPKEDFLKLMHSNRQVALRFVKMLAHNASDNEQRLLDLAYNSVRKRVAQSLMLLKERMGSTNSAGHVSFNFSREDLANMAGTSTESAIRALSDFKSEGLIDMKGGNITLLNVTKLERLRN